MNKIVPNLWFDGNADEAVDFYLSIFRDGKRLESSNYTAAGPGVEGDTMVISFELMSTKFTAINAGPEFKFTPAISFEIDCKDEAEVDYYWDKLLDGGEADECGWLTDRYGVSWQVVPEAMNKFVTDPDRDKVDRVMRAMFQMKKLDVARLEAAARG